MTASAAAPASPAGGADSSCGGVRAIDAATGAARWEFKYPTPTSADLMSTAAGIVFAGDSEGNVIALDARTGKDLWHYQTGSAIFGSANTYMLDGRQYVLLPSGTNLTAFALPESGPRR